MSAQRAEQPVTLTAKLSKAKVSPGEEVLVTFTLKAKSSLKLQLPEYTHNLAGLRITSFGTNPLEKEDDYTISSSWIKVVADLKGSYVLPGMSFTYRDVSEKTVSTGELFVEVLSVGAGGDTKVESKLIDIKALEVKQIPLQEIAIFSALFLVVLGAALFYWHKRRPKKDAQFIPTPLAPHQEALRQLEELKCQLLQGGGEFKLFYFSLSAVMRNYLEGRYSFGASDLTTEEIKVRIRDQVPELNSTQRDQLLKILVRTDTIKFTDTVPTTEASEELLSESEVFVKATKPEEVAL